MDIDRTVLFAYRKVDNVTHRWRETILLLGTYDLGLLAFVAYRDER